MLISCVAEQEMILPTKEQRVSRVDAYKICVSYAINQSYNNLEPPESIVRASMASCKNVKRNILIDYPKAWRENFEKQIDEEVFKEEIAWVLETRKAGK
jgi:hypothetical protein